jgi:tetratricopeptide (TPR) repeat protein
LAGTALALALLPAAAAAQDEPAPAPGDDATAQAAQSFDVGIRLLGEQNWAGALAAFERAYALVPNYVVLFNIGQCLKELHRYPEALETFQRYLEEGGEAIRPDRRQQAEAAIVELRLFISNVRLAANVEGARLRVDGRDVGTSPLPGPLVLGAGHHVVEATASGHRDARAEFDLGGGDDREVVLTLEPLETVAPPQVPETPETPEPPGEWYEDWLGWTLAGGGLGLAGAGAYFLWYGADRDAQADELIDIHAAQIARDDAKMGWAVGGSLLGVGVGALATGIVLLVLHDEPAAETASGPASEGAGVGWMPLLGPAGFGVAGTF